MAEANAGPTTPLTTLPQPTTESTESTAASSSSTAVSKPDRTGPLPPPIADDIFSTRFLRSLHTEFVLSLDKHTDSFEYCATEHLKMSAVYWALMTLDLIHQLHLMPRQAVIDWVAQCRHPSGGYGGNIGHDAHILYTLSAIQILYILDAEHTNIDRQLTASYIASLQQSDGSFTGDEWGEVDTRFTYCALNAMALLGELDRLDVPKAMEFVAKCRNFDGGFGAVPGAESHSGQIFVCVGALCIGDSLHLCDAGVLGWWLSERQTPTGGLNGRPEKKPDVCYSWWVLSALSVMERLSWIDSVALCEFVLACQDSEVGGLSDRPGNMSDIFHTFFGIAALSLLGCRQLNEIDPVYAMPLRCVERAGCRKKYEKR